MSEIQDNEILADCAWFADKHRGENKQSGPYWSTIIRFPKLYDEAIRLQAENDKLRSTSVHTFEPRQTIYPLAVDEDAYRQAQWRLHYAVPSILWKLNQEEEMRPEEKVKKFKFYYDDLEVATFCVMETNCRKIIGMTVCHPKDKRNDYIGKKMAFTDAVSKLAYRDEREKAWKKFFRKYPIPEDRKKFGE